MRALFLKEFRQGRPLLIFSLVMALLLPAAYRVLSRALVGVLWWAELGRSGLEPAFAILALVPPLLVALLAGAGLFAGEADHGTVPVLFGLPLSRRRIWAAKVLAGLALTVTGAALIQVSAAVLMPVAYRSLPATAYLPDLCLALVFVFATAAFVSSITSYVVGAVVGAVLLTGALALVMGIVVTNLGGLLLFYDPLIDVVLWLFLAAPALLLASALAVTRGELLQSARKHAFAVPALVVGLLVTIAAVSVVGRIATRYSRGDVKAISAMGAAEVSPVVLLEVQADPVRLARFPGTGWSDRPLFPDYSRAGVTYEPPRAEPLYRGNHGVVLDLRTGRELWTIRRAYQDWRFCLAVSTDGRFAAATTGPLGLTWGGPSWRYAPQRLRIVDLKTGRATYDGVPAPLRERKYVEISDLKWSPHGDYLAFVTDTTSYGSRSYRYTLGPLYVMRPDGSGLRQLAARPASEGWAWSPAGDVIYQLDWGCRIYRIRPDGTEPERLWMPSDQQSGKAYTMSAPSPDGRWLVVNERAEHTSPVPPQRGTPGSGIAGEPTRKCTITSEAFHAISTDGAEERVILSIGEERVFFWPEYRPEATRRSVVAWSSDGRALFALVWIAQGRAQLYRWRPGDASLVPVGAPHTYSGSVALAPRPKSDEVLVWPRPRPGVTDEQPLLVTGDGKMRPVLSSEFAAEHRLVSMDDAGRLITVLRSPTGEAVYATDLDTGKSERIYP